MDRKDFIKKELLGTGMFVGSTAVTNIMKSNIFKIKPLQLVAFNYLPSFDTPVTDYSVLHKAESRGYSDHRWLDTYQTFSFALITILKFSSPVNFRQFLISYKMTFPAFYNDSLAVQLIFSENQT